MCLSAALKRVPFELTFTVPTGGYMKRHTLSLLHILSTILQNTPDHSNFHN